MNYLQVVMTDFKNRPGVEIDSNPVNRPIAPNVACVTAPKVLHH